MPSRGIGHSESVILAKMPQNLFKHRAQPRPNQNVALRIVVGHDPCEAQIIRLPAPDSRSAHALGIESLEPAVRVAQLGELHCQLKVWL